MAFDNQTEKINPPIFAAILLENFDPYRLKYLSLSYTNIVHETIKKTNCPRSTHNNVGKVNFIGRVLSTRYWCDKISLRNGKTPKLVSG